MQESLRSLSFVYRHPLSLNVEVTVGAVEAVSTAVVAEVSTAVVVFQAAITGEVPASAAIAAVGMATAAAGTEVRRAAVTAEEEAGPRPAEVVVPLRQDGTRSRVLRQEDLDSEDSGTLGALAPVIERQLPTGSGIRSEGAAVGLIEARALGVVSAGGAASADGVFGVIVASAGDAGVAGLVLVLATVSAGILSGFGHRTGIARGGGMIIRFTRIRTSSGYLSAGSGYWWAG